MSASSETKKCNFLLIRPNHDGAKLERKFVNILIIIICLFNDLLTTKERINSSPIWYFISREITDHIFLIKKIDDEGQIFGTIDSLKQINCSLYV